MKNDCLSIMVQAIYGNRTCVVIDQEDFDYLMIGCLDRSFYRQAAHGDFDRTIVRVPGTNHLVCTAMRQSHESAAVILGSNPSCFTI